MPAGQRCSGTFCHGDQFTVLFVAAYTGYFCKQCLQEKLFTGGSLCTLLMNTAGISDKNVALYIITDNNKNPSNQLFFNDGNDMILGRFVYLSICLIHYLSANGNVTVIQFVELISVVIVILRARSFLGFAEAINLPGAFSN